jgi:predicted PurR-regulated permease PerM
MRQVTRSEITSAQYGTWILLLTTFIMATLYFAQSILIPLALALLITFLLTPIAARMERWLGRVVSVLLLVVMLFVATGFIGWVFTRQLVDLARKLPDYKENIQSKILSFQMPSGGAFSRFSATVEEIRRDLVGTAAPKATPPMPATTAAPTEAQPPPAGPAAPPATILESARNSGVEIARSTFGLVVGPLGTGGLVLLLVVVMLLQREDLRGRLIRLIGKGRISETTYAMDDAGSRVARYLLLQLAVNVSYGICLGIGLSFIGVPTAVLCGVVAAVLRFIPYVGPWIAAVIPITLSLAISAGWMAPLMVIGLIVVLEVIVNNVVEPWLYGSSTGVSPLALIVAAVFWTWLWGPVGLVLATPLTVCLVVMGRHVPKLEFLSVLLSDNRALEPHEECYHRLLAQDLNKADALVETYLKTNSVTTLYDAVLIPVIIAAELDFRRGALDEEQCNEVRQFVRELVEETEDRPAPAAKAEPDDAIADAPIEPPMPATCRVLCLPAHAEREELTGTMLAQLLRPPAMVAQSASRTLMTSELCDLAETAAVDAVCISVIAPSTVVHARHLCAKLRARLPKLKIVIGLWGTRENISEAGQRLRKSGADEIVVSLAEAVAQLTKRRAE